MSAGESARDRAARAAYVERLAFGATEGRRCQYRSYWDGDMPEDRKARDYAIVDAVLAEYQDTALAVLRAGLQDALEGMEDMRSYVPDYFSAKWKHDGYIDRARALLAEHTTEEE